MTAVLRPHIVAYIALTASFLMTITASCAKGPGASTEVERIERRRKNIAIDLGTPNRSCISASRTGGFVHACRAAAEDNIRAMGELRDLEDKASSLSLPNKEFQGLWLNAIKCQIDNTRLDRDYARALEVNAKERARGILGKAMAHYVKCVDLDIEVLMELVK